MSALQVDLTPRDVRGTVSGLQEFFFNGGIFAGSILGGFLTKILTPEVYKFLSLSLEGIIIPFWLTGLVWP